MAEPLTQTDDVYRRPEASILGDERTRLRIRHPLTIPRWQQLTVTAMTFLSLTILNLLPTTTHTTHLMTLIGASFLAAGMLGVTYVARLDDPHHDPLTVKQLLHLEALAKIAGLAGVGWTTVTTVTLLGSAAQPSSISIPLLVPVAITIVLFSINVLLLSIILNYPNVLYDDLAHQN